MVRYHWSKAAIKISCFGVLLAFTLLYVDKVLAVKYEDGIYGLTTFYELEENTVDVLVLGSSHAFANIDTGILWDDYGIASYILGGSIQPMWNTYYYLKDALKTQSPELIVLEAHTTTMQSDYIDDSRIIKNTYGMNWSKNKIDAIKVSSPPERWTDFLLSYSQYHNRYTELTKDDFLINRGSVYYRTWKGFYYELMGTTVFDPPNVGGISERGSMSQKTEEYYRKTIELALEHDIPILIVASPYAITEWEQSVFNTASDIAEKYRVPFINYNLLYESIGIDYSSDMADIAHLNFSGRGKYTRALGGYIKENYDIPDRRNNQNYNSWEMNARYLSAVGDNRELLAATEMWDITPRLLSENYTVIVSVDGNCTTSDENLSPLFDVLDIPCSGERGIWYITSQTEFHDSISGNEEADTYMCLDSHDIRISRKFDNTTQEYSNTVVFDNVMYKKVSNGVNVFIYDSITQILVDVFGINVDDAYRIVR